MSQISVVNGKKGRVICSFSMWNEHQNLISLAIETSKRFKEKVTKTFDLVNVGIQFDFNVLIVNPLFINTETLKESI